MSYKSTELFATAVKAMLDKRAAEDELFAEAYAKEGKSIEDCCTFIIGEVQKMGVNALSDEEVLSLAVHYYDEDNISVGARVSCKVIVPTTPEIDEMRKAELREKAERDFYDSCFKDMKKTSAKAPKRKEAEVESTPSLSLF
jgi:hypothetical protein